MKPRRNPLRRARVRGLFAAAFLALLPCSRLAAEPAKDLIDAVLHGDTAAASAAIKAGAPTTGIPAARALNVAVTRDDRAMTDLLLDAGVPVDEVNSHNTNALMQAALNGREELVAHLLERGADATFIASGEDGSRPLALNAAVKGGSLKIVKMLLDHGADPNASDSRPVEIANFSGREDLYLALKAAGGRDRPHPLARRPEAPKLLAFLQAEATKAAAANAGLITLLSTPPPPAAARPATGRRRLAIIADEPNAAAADLLTARLSASPTLDLVERAELDRILAEQKLTRDLGADAGARLAGLLGADALLLIGTRDATSGRVVEARVVNVHPGLILATFFRPAPLADPGSLVEELDARIPALVTQAAARDGVALALLNVRATVATPAAREMEKTANLLLANRLLREPGFFLLERSAFEQVAQEIALGKKAADTFWTGSYTVDATFDPPLTAGDEIVFTLRFRPGDGAAIEVQARGPREKLAAVLNEAVAKIHAALTRAPVPVPPVEEAAHFVKEAHWQVEAGQFQLARQSMDTAWALGAHDFAARRYRLLCHAWALQIPIAEAQRRTHHLSALTGSPSGTTWETRDYYNQPFIEDDFPSAEAVFAESLEILRQYDDGWREAGQSDAQLAAWLDAGGDTLRASFDIAYLLDTAAMKIRYAEDLTRLRTAIKGMYQKVMGLTPAGAASTLAQGEMVGEFGRTLLIWPASFAQAKEAHGQMMALHFPGNDDFYLRAKIRHFLLLAPRGCGQASSDPALKDWNGRESLGYHSRMTRAQRESLSARFKTAEAADDRLYAWIDAGRNAEGDLPAQRVALQMMMALAWEVFPELARDQRLTREFYTRDCPPLAYQASFSAAQGESYNDGNDFYFTPEIREFRRRMFVALAARHPDLLACEYLLIREKYSPAEAAEIVPALAAQLAGQPDGEMLLRYKCRIFGLPEPGGTANPAAMPKPLAITKFWEPSALGLGPGRSFRISTNRMAWAENRLWLVGDFFDRWVNNDHSVPYVFSIEFPSLRAVALPLPPEIKWGTMGRGSLMVTPQRLIVAEREFALLIYDRQKKTWEKVPEIRPVATPEILGDDLYVFIAGGLLRYDMSRRSVEVLVSRRRSPAQSPLDEVPYTYFQMRWQPGPELEVRLYLEGEKQHVCFGYSPLTRTWRKIGPPLPFIRPADRKAWLFPGVLGWAQVAFSKREGPYYFSPESGPAPTAGIQLEFATDEAIEERSRANSSNPPISIFPQDILATPFGWIISEGGTDPKYIWFLPLADLKKYLRENPAAAKMIAEYETTTGMPLVPKDTP